jgi:phage baseplate assembly protein gpV|eukprot:COSAG02_NODE_11_length_58539_cov_103.119473_19_plen_52_part_00
MLRRGSARTSREDDWWQDEVEEHVVVEVEEGDPVAQCWTASVGKRTVLMHP